MDYKIKLDVYEGPYELLYNLVKDAKINIYDISFVNIIDQYLQYIELIEDINPEIYSNFILITSSLLEIKSKMLLPNKKSDDDNPDDNEEFNETPKINEFFSTFEEYIKYKNAASELRKMELEECNIFYKKNDVVLNKINKLNVHVLANTYQKFENHFNSQYHKSKMFSIKTKITSVLKLLSKFSHITFNKFIKNSKTKEDIISYLFAVLELEKRNFVITFQTSNFEEIVIRRGKNNER